MYTQTTLQLALLDRSVVYVDGKVHHLQPDPWADTEEVEVRDRNEQNNRAEHLSRPRGKYNRILPHKKGLTFIGHQSQREVPRDVPVWAYEDLVWLKKDPYVGLRNSVYTSLVDVPYSQVVDDAFKFTYVVVDGRIVRARHHPSRALGVNYLPDGERALALSSPDFLTFVNQPLGRVMLLQDDLRMFKLGRYWADTDRERAQHLRRLPASGDGPSVEF